LQRRTGIVLMYKGRNISVLEEHQGRVDAIFYTSLFAQSRVQKGSVITYYIIRDKYQNMLLQDVVIEHTPLEWGRHDIYFLHYLLEICFYFVPQGGGCKETFNFFLQLFDNYAHFSIDLHKKRVIGKLFSHLGVYPNDSQVEHCVELFLKTPIDNLVRADLQLANEDLLDKWIFWCMQTHPQRQWFRAIPTLLKSDES
jgi:hypothetical protein